MGDSRLIDLLPIWGIFVTTVGFVVFGMEAGYRLGAFRRRRACDEDRPPVGEIVAATLALLALMLAFTFGVAASRFDVRRVLVIDEANAIGTTYLCAGLLPEPHQTEVRGLLRDYVEARLEGVRPGRLERGLALSESLQSRLWAQAEAAGRRDPNSIMTGLFIQSLNEMIDLHARRVGLGVRGRIPTTIWAALFAIALLGTSVIGYHCGLSGSDRSPAMLALVVAFALVFTLNVDLDRPQEGILRVSQQSLVDLQRSIGAPTP